MSAKAPNGLCLKIYNIIFSIAAFIFYSLGKWELQHSTSVLWFGALGCCGLGQKASAEPLFSPSAQLSLDKELTWSVGK